MGTSLKESCSGNPKPDIEWDHFPTALYASTMDGKLIHANSAFVKLLGYATLNELRAIPIEKLWWDPERRKHLKVTIESDPGHLVKNYLVDLKTKAGERLPVMLDSHLVGSQGSGQQVSEGWYYGIIKDLTAINDAQADILNDLADLWIETDPSFKITRTGSQGKLLKSKGTTTEHQPLEGSNIRDLVRKEERDRFDSDFLKSIATHEPSLPPYATIALGDVYIPCEIIRHAKHGGTNINGFTFLLKQKRQPDLVKQVKRGIALFSSDNFYVFEKFQDDKGEARFTRVNQKFCELYNRSEKDIIGRRQEDLSGEGTPMTVLYNSEFNHALGLIEDAALETITANVIRGDKILTQSIKVRIWEDGKAGVRCVFWRIDNEIDHFHIQTPYYDQHFIDNLPIGIFTSENKLDGRILMANRALGEILGYRDAEDLNPGPAVQELYDTPSREEIMAKLARSSGAVVFRAQLRKNGSSIPIKVLEYNWFSDQRASIQGIVVDITEEITMLASERAALATKVRLDLLRNVQHVLNHEFRKQLREIQEKIAGTSDESLKANLERADAGINAITLREEHDEFDLANLILDLVVAARKDHKTVIKATTPWEWLPSKTCRKANPQLFYGSYWTVRLAFDNLLNNAVQHSKKGTPVIIAVTTLDDRIHLTITNELSDESARREMFKYWNESMQLDPFLRPLGNEEGMRPRLGLRVVQDFLNENEVTEKLELLFPDITGSLCCSVHATFRKGFRNQNS